MKTLFHLRLPFMTILAIAVAYLIGSKKGYKKGLYEQWFMTEVLNYVVWNGTGEDRDLPNFPGLNEFMGDKHDTPQKS